MREKYWELYERVKFSERYLYHYREKARRKDHRIKAFLTIASLSSIANLMLWEKIQFLWAIIAVVTQVLSAVAYLIPFSDQVTALNYLLPELDQLLHRIDYDWDRINILQELSDSEINDLVLRYNREFSNLETKYAGNTQFSPNSSCIKKANKDCETFKFTRFGITETNYLEEVTGNGSV